MPAMADALKILGYPTLHGRELFAKIGEADMWDDAFQAKFFPAEPQLKPFGRTEFDQLLGPYAAVADTPSVCFGPDLIKAYPEAKVILVERDIESWYKSYYDVIIAYTFHPLANFLAWLEPELVGPNVRNMHTIARAYFRANTKEEYAANAKAVYREHYREIRQVTPEERLLEFDLKQGWEPLCEFLGRPVPDVPFPRTNDAMMNEEWRIIIQARIMRQLVKKTVIVLTAVGLLGWSINYLSC